MLIANPKATVTTSRLRDVLVRALASELKLEVAETDRRGHGTALAAQARRDGFDLVVAFGGDGTVHEVVNGLLRDGPDPGPGPALGIVPGGDANVAARNLGLPEDPVGAVSVLLDCLRSGARRSIGLGCAEDRFFILNAGLGFDASVVRAVDAARRAGRPSAPSRYVAAALRQYLRSDHRRPALRLALPGESGLPKLFMTIVSNSSPWTYAGRLALSPTPQASYQLGLDLLAMSSLSPWAFARAAVGLPGASAPGGRAVLARHDLASFTVQADRPVDFQADGEYLGERSEVTFRSVPNALDVLAPGL